jgi:hypothetical protein
MTEATEQRVSEHFPPRVREALIEASRIPSRIERMERIDIVNEWARATWHELFKREV